MIPPIHQEPERDPLLAGALQAVGVETAGGDAPLVRRIVHAAAPQLAALRRTPRPWWEWTASWARVAVPVGIAASLAAGALLLQASDAAAGDALVTESALVLGDGEGGTLLAAELLPQPTEEWLLTEALDR